MQTATHQTVEQLKQTLLTKWPDAIPRTATYTAATQTLPATQSQLSITFGQIAELTGGESSGKTSLIASMLPASKMEPAYCISLLGRVYFLPTTHSVHLEVRNLKEAISTCLAIIGAAAMRRIVLDLSNLQTCKDSPTPIWYQLRRTVVRQYAHLIILTPDNSRLLPDSVVTKKIRASRNAEGAIHIETLKSRVGGEGMHGDIASNT